MTTRYIFLPGKFHGQMTLVDYIQSMGSRELDTPEHIHLSSTMLLQFHFIFSNILQTNGISILV